MRPQYLLVDGHSIIFAWPELRPLHERRTSLAREALTQQLRDYQDWTGIHVVVVFDGRGATVSQEAEPGEIQVFYSRAGQTADSIIERLASKYAERFRLVVATGDYLEQETASAREPNRFPGRAARTLARRAASLGGAEQGGAGGRWSDSRRARWRQVARTRERTQ